MITGTPGAGKSTVATALMQRFPFGIHVPVDDIRDWVVSGIAYPGRDRSEETTRQFALARKGAAQLARLYAESGFAVAIDDTLGTADTLDVYLQALQGCLLLKIMLRPQLEVALARNRERTNKNYDKNRLAQAILHLYPAMGKHHTAERGWRIIDNSHLSVAETVDTILNLAGLPG
jgi:predicted kinase